MQFHSNYRSAIVKSVLSILPAVALLAGCASFSGSSLVPGTSVGSDVEALMGTPAERVTTTDGGHIWYYPRQPTGMQTFAVRFSSDGVLRGIEQRLTVANLAKLVPGVTQSQQARQLLGPPWRVTRNDRLARDVWEYRMYDESQEENDLAVQFSDDGLVREVLLLRDYWNEPGGDLDSK